MRGSHLLASILAITVLGTTSLLAYPATVNANKAERLAKQFVFERLRGQNGAILAYGKVRRVLLFPTYDPEDLLASGVLSETAGLAMQYAVLAGEKKLFDEQFKYVRDHMMGRFGLFFWKISHDAELTASSSASVDDLRIVGACLAAFDRWGEREYQSFVEDVAENIRRFEVVDGVLRDFYNWRDYGEPVVADTLRLSYIDTGALGRLAAQAEDWKGILHASGRVLMAGQLENGLFHERYDFTAGQYEGLQQNMINQLYCALFALPQESDRHLFHTWLKRRFDADGAIYAEYDSRTGEPSKFFESTSVYALAARYALLVGDHDLSVRFLEKLMGFQNLNPLSPMYGGFCDDEVYSFDNLEALISLRLHNAG